MTTLSSLRRKAHRLNESCFMQVLALTDIVVSAKEGGGSCDVCKGPMRVQKTFRHEGRTIEHGTFTVRETVYVCATRCRNEDGSLVDRS